MFLQCLFACCLEIVIWSYKNNDRLFPWILQSLNVEAYYFYKVIEIIVRAEQLPRDVVKHLNNIEEKILESLAWKSDSPLWQAIEQIPGGVPSCADVSLPGTIDPDDSNTSGQPALRRLAIDRGTAHDVQQSPISSASERYFESDLGKKNRHNVFSTKLDRKIRFFKFFIFFLTDSNRLRQLQELPNGGFSMTIVAADRASSKRSVHRK